MIQSSGMNTSLPQLGPTWKGMPRALCRVPMVMPGVLVGIRARVMPSEPGAQQVLGIQSRNARPSRVATGPRVM